MRYTLDASVGFKAFDGPPLTPQDVKDLLRRNVGISLTTPEAIALIVQFSPCDKVLTRKGRVGYNSKVLLVAAPCLRCV